MRQVHRFVQNELSEQVMYNGESEPLFIAVKVNLCLSKEFLFVTIVNYYSLW